jgi:hypothetical protein
MSYLSLNEADGEAMRPVTSVPALIPAFGKFPFVGSALSQFVVAELPTVSVENLLALAVAITTL